MARQDLSAMLSTPPQADLSLTPLEASPEAVKPLQPSKSPEVEDDASATRQDPAEGAGYRSFARKEAKIRDDQYTALTAHARRLTRIRPAGTERITENTLIRVAIDLLLARSDQIAGGSEAEIRKSVGL
ncbi:MULTISPECIES: hypothetical protein [unclassified Rathayibacter]|uniref:hypothetical protein n=1 Tax=unclassified Rathayibacter TaxID=2609250 RepID=UPI001C61607F|nr:MULTISPECIES: hypothetical protein [unclassified Rathayibacter]